jgi:hypothetical protein
MGNGRSASSRVSGSGGGSVDEVVERYLDCGILENGFAETDMRLHSFSFVVF